MPTRPEQQPLGLRNELVAGPDDHVRRGLAREVPMGHGSDGLHAAERHDDVGTRGLHRIQDIRVNASPL